MDHQNTEESTAIPNEDSVPHSDGRSDNVTESEDQNELFEDQNELFEDQNIIDTTVSDADNLNCNAKSTESKSLNQRPNNRLSKSSKNVRAVKNTVNSPTRDESEVTSDDNHSNHASQIAALASIARRKETRNLDNLLKYSKNYHTPEEKLGAVFTQYHFVVDENKQLKNTVKQNERQLENKKKDCDSLKAELDKSNTARAKLESLCRELQRQNKVIQEESLLKEIEREQKRKEISEKFQTTVDEITSLMKKDSEKTSKLFDSNVDMSAKLKAITEQHELREQQVDRLTKQMTLEAQLYEAKMAKLKMEGDAEKEILLREKQELLVNLTEYQARCKEYQNIELALRNQIAIYSSKYEEFQNTLMHSNEVFTKYKKEIDTMSHKIVNLQNETETWKQRWENTHKNLLQLTNEKKRTEYNVETTAKQLSALHKLCRALQQERAQLLKKLAQFDQSGNYRLEEESTAKLADEEPAGEVKETVQGKKSSRKKKKHSSKSSAANSSVPCTDTDTQKITSSTEVTIVNNDEINGQTLNGIKQNSDHEIPLNTDKIVDDIGTAEVKDCFSTAETNGDDIKDNYNKIIPAEEKNAVDVTSAVENIVNTEENGVDITEQVNSEDSHQQPALLGVNSNVPIDEKTTVLVDSNLPDLVESNKTPSDTNKKETSSTAKSVDTNLSDLVENNKTPSDTNEKEALSVIKSVVSDSPDLSDSAENNKTPSDTNEKEALSVIKSVVSDLSDSAENNKTPSDTNEKEALSVIKSVVSDLSDSAENKSPSDTNEKEALSVIKSVVSDLSDPAESNKSPSNTNEKEALSVITSTDSILSDLVENKLSVGRSSEKEALSINKNENVEDRNKPVSTGVHKRKDKKKK